MRSLVISIFLYACESWTLTAELEKRTQAFEMRCYRRLLNISYKDHVTNEEVRRKIQAAIGEYDKLLTLVKKRKLRWFGHVSRSSGLAKTILQGTVKGKRKRGRQKKRWEDKFKEWTGMGIFRRLIWLAAYIQTTNNHSIVLKYFVGLRKQTVLPVRADLFT